MAEPQLRFAIGAHDTSKAAFQSFRGNVRGTKAELQAMRVAGDSTFDRMSMGLNRSILGMSGLAGQARLVATALGGAALLNTVKELSDIKDNAERAGLAIKDFQRLAFASRQAGGTGDDIVDLFQKLNKELATAATKGGDLAKILSANNIATEGRKTVDVFLDIVDLMGKARNETEKTVIMQAAFKRGAGDMLPLLNQTADAIRKQGDESERLGIVIDKDLVTKIEAIGDKWGKLWDVWASGALSNIARVAIALDSLFPENVRGGQTLDDIDKAFGLETMKAQREKLREQLGGLNELNRTVMAPKLEAAIEELTRTINALTADIAGGGYDPLSSIRAPGRGGSLVIPHLGDGAADAIKKGSGGPRGLPGLQPEDLEKAYSAETAALIRAQNEELKKSVALADEFRGDMREGFGDFVEILRDGKVELQEISALLTSLGNKLINRGLDKLVDYLLGPSGTTQPGALGGLFFGGGNGGGAAPDIGQLFGGAGGGVSGGAGSGGGLAKIIPALGDIIGSADGVATGPIARAAGRERLAGFARGNARGTGTSGLDPAFASSLLGFLEDAPEGFGFYSGYRSIAKQSALFNASDRSGRMVARPGHSQHNFGKAADLSFNGVRLDEAPQSARTWAQENAGRHGLNFRMGWEPWHIEPIKQVADNFKAEMAKVNPDVAQNFAGTFQSLFSGGGGGQAGGATGGSGLLGQIGGFLGSLFGGMFAEGGRPPRGKISVVGEKGPELFVPDSAGAIIPRGGRGGVQITMQGSQIVVQGNPDDRTLALMRRQLDERDGANAKRLKREFGAIGRSNAMLHG